MLANYYKTWSEYSLKITTNLIRVCNTFCKFIRQFLYDNLLINVIKLYSWWNAKTYNRSCQSLRGSSRWFRRHRIARFIFVVWPVLKLWVAGILNDPFGFSGFNSVINRVILNNIRILNGRIRMRTNLKYKIYLIAKNKKREDYKQLSYFSDFSNMTLLSSC